MVARRAWVVTVHLREALGDNELPGDPEQRVIALLRPSLTGDAVRTFLEYADMTLAMELSAQRGLISHPREGRRHFRLDSGTNAYLLSEPYDYQAHKSTIVALEETDHGDLLTWQPDAYDLMSIVAHEPVVATHMEFPKKSALRAKFVIGG